jgi:mono/diheme cytochrome c family protein
MRIGAWLGVGLLTCGLPYLALSQNSLSRPLSSIPNLPWPASVATNLPDAPPALSPQEALKTFTMPPGYRLELVASEPLVRDPILSEFDADGRLWVLEMRGFAVNQRMDNSFEPINELAILEDTNGDGVYDKRTVFMDKLIMPRAFKVLAGNCALVGEPPNLWKACDTDGDGKSDTKELISSKFSTQGVVEHGANGLYWAMDNRIVISQNDWDLSLKGGKPTITAGLSRGQWGLTQDDAGRIYRTFNTDPIFIDYLNPSYYARNPNLVRTRGLYEMLADPTQSRIWPARPTFGINRGYRKEGYREDGSSLYYGGVSSPMIYRGTALPRELQGNPFVVDGPTNIVHLLRMHADASGNLSTTDFYERGEFLASTDERFRPVSMAPGWDGSFYIVDMYRGVSQDGPLQTDYLRSYIQQRGLWEGIHYGRIYRVVHEGMKTDARPRMSSQSAKELVAHLSHHNGWWRDTAQQLLVQRGDKSVVPALAKLAGAAPDPRTRLHALWTLDGLGAADIRVIEKAMRDSDPHLRASAVRLMEERLRKGDKAALAAVTALADDPILAVRRQAAASLGEAPAAQRTAPLLAILKRHGSDPVTVDAVISGLSGLEADMLARLLAEPDAPATADPVQQLAAAIGRSRNVDAVEAALNHAHAPARSGAIRLALLAGLQTGLQGAPRAGAPAAGAQAPRLLSLKADPQALRSIANGQNDLAPAATKLLAVLDWPGKPAAPAVATRSPEEQRLFAAGREIYANMCQGCHLEQGRGSEIASNLDGSRFATGRPDLFARILLNGKEGDIGLMPPAGAAMSDEELASVMTYIRASWSNRAAPVLPSAIKEWRDATSHRETPWTAKELEQQR